MGAGRLRAGPIQQNNYIDEGPNGYSEREELRKAQRVAAEKSRKAAKTRAYNMAGGLGPTAPGGAQPVSTPGPGHNHGRISPLLEQDNSLKPK